MKKYKAFYSGNCPGWRTDVLITIEVPDRKPEKGEYVLSASIFNTLDENGEFLDYNGNRIKLQINEHLMRWNIFGDSIIGDDLVPISFKNSEVPVKASFS
jgi:hypothetical protein